MAAPVDDWCRQNDFGLQDDRQCGQTFQGMAANALGELDTSGQSFWSYIVIFYTLFLVIIYSISDHHLVLMNSSKFFCVNSGPNLITVEHIVSLWG